ncbi:MAG: DUF86 domain-containing protein [Bacteroidales bacterium]|nr:DUF86 domain-containing protein [Bacteroidales bacterium]
MEKQVNKLLSDVLSCISRIEQFTEEIRVFEEYQANALVQNAVERNVEIIGEAMNSLLKISPDINITSARKIVNTRYLLIHGYDSVDTATVWVIIRKHIPVLKEELSRLILTS